MCYTGDTTYSPLLLSLLYGQDGVHYQEFKTCTIGEINGWYVVGLVMCCQVA